MDSKKRIAVIGAGQPLGQHLAQSLNAQNHMREMMRRVTDDAIAAGFRVEAFQDEIQISPFVRDDLERLARGIKTHEEAEQMLEAWRQGYGKPMSEIWAAGDGKSWLGVDMAKPFADLSALEQRIVFDEAHIIDKTIHRLHWPQMLGRGVRLIQRHSWHYMPWPAGHHKPDRQPRGKAFKRMIKLGYQWRGKR